MDIEELRRGLANYFRAAEVVQRLTSVLDEEHPEWRSRVDRTWLLDEIRSTPRLDPELLGFCAYLLGVKLAHPTRAHEQRPAPRR